MASALAFFMPALAQDNPTPVPTLVDAGTLPTKTLLASEPLELELDGPYDLTYTISAPETISLYVHSLPTNSTAVDTTLEIDDAQGNEIVFNDDLNDTSRDAGVENVTLPKAGTYTIHINSFDLLQGGGVEVQLITADAPTKGNTSSGNLVDETGHLDGTNPSDFTFDGTAGQVVNITAQAINSSDADLNLTLYGPDGTQIGSDDDSGASNGLGASDPAMMAFTLPSTGTYKVEVSSWFNTPGDFNVKVTPG